MTDGRVEDEFQTHVQNDTHHGPLFQSVIARATCYYPLRLLNREGDRLGTVDLQLDAMHHARNMLPGLLAAKLRHGNVHIAEGREELFLLEVARQQGIGKEVVFRWEDCRRERSKEGQLRAFGCCAGTKLTRSAACGSTRCRRPD